jgi:formate--tetrahydrofolate ligase
MRSDIEIAQDAMLKPISTIADRLDIPSEALIPYGHYIAKLDRGYTQSL